MKFKETIINGFIHESISEMKARNKLNAELGIKRKFSQQKAAPMYSYIAVKKKD